MEDTSEIFTITTRLRRFSSCNAEDSLCMVYDGHCHLFKKFFNLTFYAKGSCPENEGHVSIIFNGKDRSFGVFLHNAMIFSCVVSVIDASGNKRFSQSFTLHYAHLSKEELDSFRKGFGFEKFIKRSTLLSDPSELLPDDSLTLCLEIELVMTEIFNVGRPLKLDLEIKEDKCYLPMNTEFARYLCKISSVFERMMECPMVEKETERVLLPYEESENLKIIHRVFLKYVNASIFHICQLYLFADKYDMQEIIETCYQLLISLMSAINSQETLDCVEEEIHHVSELADRFEDDKILREILKIYSDVKNKIAGGAYEFNAPNSSDLKTEWTGKHWSRGVFFFAKIKSESLEIDVFK